MPTFTCPYCGRTRCLPQASFSSNKFCNSCYQDRLKAFIRTNGKCVKTEVFGMDSVRVYSGLNNEKDDFHCTVSAKKS